MPRREFDLDVLPPDQPVGDESAEPESETPVVPDPEPEADDRAASLAAMLGVVRPPGEFFTMAAQSGMTVLDPNIAFERAIEKMVLTARRKRADYALLSDEFSNFRGPAALLGIPAWLYALGEVQWKLERVKSLRANGRLDDPENEAVDDTVLDAAVFGVLALALSIEERSAAGG